MTGFGDASEQVDGIHYAVEVRSLNNRYFKPTIRLPEDIAGLEAELETTLRKQLSRGSITLTVKMRPTRESTHQINDKALLAYLNHLETIHQQFETRKDEQRQTITIDLTALLALPGVLQPGEEQAELLDRARKPVLALTRKACERLLAMRAAEGSAIGQDLLKQGAFVQQRIAIVAARAPTVVEEYHQRLRNRIDELLARAELKVDQVDLTREVAVFAERADIAEELHRLGAHLEHIEKIIQSADGEPAGRTLDFLAQELLREANTIASKSNDAAIARAIVEVKGAIDRIKEQVQNVE